MDFRLYRIADLLVQDAWRGRRMDDAASMIRVAKLSWKVGG